MHPDLWQNLTFLLILLYFCLYSLLDGFDLGIGMLVPFTRPSDRAGRLVAHIAPFWDGNEVWLVIGAGTMFGAFPAAYGTLLSAFYLLFMAAIAAFILRAAALEFSYHDELHVTMWRALFGAGSALAAASGLAAVGLLLQGLPMIDPQRMSSRPADYASPFVLLVVAAGLASVLWHGLTYALAREPDQALLRLSRRLWPLAAALSLAAGVWWCISRPESLQRPLLWMGGLLFAGGLVAGRVLLVKGVWAFRSSCVSVIGIWVAAGAALYPNVLPAAGNPQWSVSIAQGAAPLSTLRLLALSGLALTPVILAYTLFVYRALGRRSRAKAPGQGGEA